MKTMYNCDKNVTKVVKSVTKTDKNVTFVTLLKGKFSVKK